MSPPDYALVIVDYNAGEDLRKAMQSVADEMQGVSWEAVVVDNASRETSNTEIVQAFAPHATLIRNAVNVGFGRAVNQGVAASTAPIVLIMNPDCRLQRGALGALRAELERQVSCAMVGPRILNPDGTLQGSARGDPDMLTGLFGRTGILRRLLPAMRVSRRNVLDADVRETDPGRTVDWLSGACVLARRSALQDVDGFDERYFLYWEDADLCRRLRTRGYHVRYVPGATAVHRVGQSSRTARASSVRAFHASAYRYYATHVARGAINPKRPIARAFLAVRCWWRVRQITAQAGADAPGED